MLLKNIVPWGRNATEYRAMFGLGEEALLGRVLDCGGGPSSFTAEMTRMGKNCLSCDPLYQFSAEEIRAQIAETYTKILTLNRENRDRFVWERYHSPEELGEVRLRAMNLFLEDYEAGRDVGRYVVGELPSLPFPDKSFDLALCSHLLFTYSENLSSDFHVQSVLELARVANEVRIFPILTAFTGDVSPHLPLIMEQALDRGLSAEVRKVDYEFQKGGNQMLVLGGGTY